MEQTHNQRSRPRVDIAFWITLGRGLFAIVLGLALFFQPDKSARMLGNFMGGFWIATGILSIRWGFAEHRSKPLTLFVGAIAVIAGATMFTRRLIGGWVREDFVVIALGIVAILTGILHLSGRMRVNRHQRRNVARSGVILGVFEIALGLVLIFAGQGGDLMYWLALGWALAGGVIILGDALYMRQEARSEAAAAHSTDETTHLVEDEAEEIPEVAAADNNQF